MRGGGEHIDFLLFVKTEIKLCIKKKTELCGLPFLCIPLSLSVLPLPCSNHDLLVFRPVTFCLVFLTFSIISTFWSPSELIKANIYFSADVASVS